MFFQLYVHFTNPGKLLEINYSKLIARKIISQTTNCSKDALKREQSLYEMQIEQYV